MTRHTIDTDPCDTCLRWSECNGVEKDTCPLCKKDGDLDE